MKNKDRFNNFVNGVGGIVGMLTLSILAVIVTWFLLVPVMLMGIAIDSVWITMLSLVLIIALLVAIVYTIIKLTN